MECREHRIRLVTPARARQVVPCNLPVDRVWRWCIEASLRDARLSWARGRLISLPNIKRLFARRWAEACRLHDMPEWAEERTALRAAGEAAVQEGYARLCTRWWGEGWAYVSES